MLLLANHLIGLSIMQQLFCKRVLNEPLKAHHMMVVIRMGQRSATCMSKMAILRWG